MNEKRSAIGSCLSSFGASLILTGIATGPVHLWDRHNPFLFSALRYPLLIGLFFTIVGIAFFRSDKRFISYFTDPFGWALGLLLIFFTDWFTRPFSLFQGVEFRGEILIGSLLMSVLIKRQNYRFFKFYLPLSLGLLIWGFLTTLGGQTLYTDDHASVLYRLELLKQHFPFIPVYNPQWNAGIDARDFFATGIINLYLLAFPLIEFFEIAEVYNIIIAGVLFVLLPLSVYAAVRELNVPALPATCSALLSVAVSSSWYHWSLAYGSMGFIVSAALLPYNTALAVRLLTPGTELSKRKALIALITFSLMLCWSMTGIALLPLVLYALFSLPRLVRKKNVLTLGVGLLVVNLPWILIFLSVSQVARFVALEAPQTSRTEMHAAETEVSAQQLSKKVVRNFEGELTVKSVLRHIREFAAKSNPLILLFAVPGLALLPAFHYRRLYIALCIWLLFLGTVAAPLKPQLELERMLLLMLLILCVPTGIALVQLFRSVEGRHFALRLPAALAGGFLIAGVFAVGAIVHNRGPSRFTTANHAVLGLAAAIEQHSGSGRTLFTGFVLHEFNGGHASPIAKFSGRPLVASSPIHNIWWYTDVVPAEFRSRSQEGIEEYFDLLNVTLTAAHERVWRQYFSLRPGLYQEVWRGGRFILYARNVSNSSYFLEGEGEVLEQSTDYIRLRVDSPEAVVKFNYLPFLESSACSLGSKRISRSTEFIALTDCTPGTVLTIRALGPFRRLFLMWG